MCSATRSPSRTWRGVAWRHRHGVGDEAVAGDRDVRPADGDDAVVREGLDRVMQPVRVRGRVVVEVGDDLARRRLGARVARARQPPVLGADDAKAVRGRDRGARVRRSVVDDDHLDVRVGEPLHRGARLAEGPRAVVRADDDAHARWARVEHDGALGKRGPHGGERRLRPALAVGEAEVPAGHLLAAAVPLVGPGEDERAGAAGCQRLADLPAQRARLLVGAVGGAVQADLREQQRTIAREVLQAVEVRAELLAALEEDVEAEEVEEPEVEVLGRRVVDVRHERGFVVGLDGVVQPAQELLGAPAPVPAHDGRRDLVADRPAEQRRVAGHGAGVGGHAADDVAHARAIVEERDVLLPREAAEHAQAVAARGVEQPARRRGVEAQRVEPAGADAREVALGRDRGVRLAVGPGRKRPVGDAAQEQLLAAGVQEAPACGDALGGRRGGRRGRRVGDSPCNRFDP